MDFKHQELATDVDRRQKIRIDALLRFNYQVIAEADAQLDPYNQAFMLPRYFQVLAELKQIDQVLDWEVERLKQHTPDMGYAFSLLNQKIDLLNATIFDSIQKILPRPQKVNISESGLSFESISPLTQHCFLHLTLSHPDNDFHIAAIAKIVYCNRQKDSTYKVGGFFTSIKAEDQQKIAQYATSNQE